MANAGNPELNAPRDTRPDQTPKPMSSLAGGIPSMDTGHTEPNFPGYGHEVVEGIPVAKSTNVLVPGYKYGDLLDIPGSTIGEKGGGN